MIKRIFAKFSGYENKVRISILLILMLLVIGNFTASYLFKSTRKLFLDSQSVNQRHLSRVCKNILLNSPDIQSGLIILNEQFKDDQEYIVDIVNKGDFKNSRINEMQLSDPNIKNAFRNIESYAYYPDIEMQIAYLPLEVENNGNVNSVFVLKSQIKWFNFLDKASRWDSIFRIAGILSVMVFGYLIIRMIIQPYKNIRSIALTAIDRNSIDLDDPDYAEKAFGTVVSELRKREDELNEMALAESRKTLGINTRYDFIFGGISSGIIICDRKGIIVRINPPASDILEINREDAENKHYCGVFSEFKDIRYLISNALNSVKTYSRVELKLKQVVGTEKILGATSSLIKDENGVNIGMAIMLIDLTQVKKIEKEQSYRDKMVSLGEMTAGLAHEIRNSSAAIGGFGKLALKYYDDCSKIKDISSNIVKEAEEMEVLMKKFLTFAKPIQLNRERINIREFFENCVNQFENTYSEGSIRIYPANTDITIFADYHLLKQCIYNLILNAYEAGEEDNKIFLKAKKVANPSALVVSGDMNGYIKISVLDNGKGIDKEIIEKIFDPFYTNKDKGTGLGLALVRKIVSLHEGTISIHSKIGKGTIISLLLPVGCSPQSDSKSTRDIKHQLI
ncbi:MAG: hypothetical protein GY855_09030 [candidate division Zixibacteria bacterium]|nr:hypothetical protein [candidate division Zixibacteria bacterium]